MNKDLIQVEGKFYKKAQVVMLATEESKLHLHKDYGEITAYEASLKEDKHSTPQHLYILSNEEIKEGEFGVNFTTGSIFRIIEKHLKEEYWDVEYITGGNIAQTIRIDKQSIAQPKKVIATTDSSLTKWETERNIGGFSGDLPLPRPSDAFIQKYVEEYNKGNAITEVLIEYNGTCTNCETIHEPSVLCMCSTTGEYDSVDKPYVIKVASDNTITIKAVVETWDDIVKGFELPLGGNFPFFLTWIKENYQVPKKK